MVWAYGSYFTGRTLTLVATAILARLISPNEFGLVALALAFMAFLDMLQGLGVGEAIVIEDEKEVEETAETVFAISVAVGFVLMLATAALGPVAAEFFDQPRLTAIMPVLGVNFLLLALGSTHYALAQKRIDFRSRTIAEMCDVVARGGTGIVLALAGAGVWSLVIGYVAGTAALTIALWWLVPWRPRLRPQRAHVRRLLTFGGALTGVGFMGAILTQFDNIVIGKQLGAEQLGFYTIATRLPYLLIVNLAVVAGQVLYPAFATLQGEDMRRGFLTSLRYAVMVALPLTAVLGILAEPFVIGLFGDQWHGAVVAAQVLTLWALMSPIGIVCGTAYKSRGRPDIQLKLAVPQAIVLIVLSLLLVDEGIVALAWVQAGIAISATIVSIGVAQRLLGVSTRRVVAAVAPPVAATAGMALALLGVNELVSDPWPAIVAGLVVGGVVYLGLLALVARDTLRHLRAVAFPKPARSELELDMLEGAAERVGTTPP
jgi:O-antigen/teichoic acid export membrane protein